MWEMILEHDPAVMVVVFSTIRKATAGLYGVHTDSNMRLERRAKQRHEGETRRYPGLSPAQRQGGGQSRRGAGGAMLHHQRKVKRGWLSTKRKPSGAFSYRTLRFSFSRKAEAKRYARISKSGFTLLACSWLKCDPASNFPLPRAEWRGLSLKLINTPR